MSIALAYYLLAALTFGCVRVLQPEAHTASDRVQRFVASLLLAAAAPIVLPVLVGRLLGILLRGLDN